MIKTVLTEENSGSGFKGLLNDDPVTTLSQFNDEGFSILINAFNEMIKSYINANLQSRQCPLTSNEQLLSARTFTIITDFPIYQKYLLEASKAFTMMKFDGYINGKCLAQKILHTILTELAGKEIAYYNTKFGFGGYARQCIFC